MHRLILIEGIPGSGKTTVAKEVHNLMTKKGLEVMQFSEGDLHPADLAWCALYDHKAYDDLLKAYPQHLKRLKEHTAKHEHFNVIAYTKLGFYPDENSLMTELSKREIYQGKVPFEQFRDIHLDLWTELAKRPGNYIFECVYFQNHIVELLGTYDLDMVQITSYLRNLMDTVKSMNPLLIYLTQQDVKTTIDRVAKERVSPDRSKWRDWIELVIEYVDAMPFSKKRNLKGYEGAIEFFKARKTIEMSVIEALDIETLIIDNSDYDLNKVMGKIEKRIEI